jgi:TPR repeat protein
MAEKQQKTALQEAIRLYEEESYYDAHAALKPLADNGDPEAQYYLGCVFIEEDFDQDYDEAAKWYAKAASQGLAKGNYSLGMLHMYGLLKQASLEEAEKFQEIAFQQGNCEGYFELAKYYAQNHNPEKAFKFFSAAAIKNHAASINGLGICYQNGMGTSKDLELAKTLYKNSCDLGYKTGCLNLAKALKSSSDSQPLDTIVEAVLPTITFLPQLHITPATLGGEVHDECYYAAFHTIIEPLAKDGDALALNYLGERELRSAEYQIHRHLSYGNQRLWRPKTMSSPEPFDIRFHYCRDLIYSYETIGDFLEYWGELARVDLSHLDSIGRHSIENFSAELLQGLNDAKNYFEQSSQQHCEFAQFNIGMMHLHGITYQKDEKVASDFLRKAASRGHIGAMAELAFLDDESAENKRVILEEAEKYEHPRALHELGASYLSPPVSQEGLRKGARNFTILARHGKTDAMYILAQLYLEGAGVEKDLTQAKELLEESSTLGFEKARELLEKLQ